MSDRAAATDEGVSVAGSADPGGGAEPASFGTRAAGWARRFGPWLLAAGLLYWITGRVSWGEAWAAARTAELGAFAAALMAAAIYWFALDSLGFSMLFSRLNAPVSWREARSVRALTYLITPINWNVGTAGVVLHLRQSKGIPAVEGTSSMLFYGGIDGLVIMGLLCAGVALLPDAGVLGSALPGVLAFFTLQLCFLGLVMADVPGWTWLERVRAARIFHAYRRASRHDVLALAALRAVYFSGFVLLFWWGTGAFGIDLPLPFTAATTPIVMGSAMFTPAGMGGQQAVMLEFYEPYGPAASILAFGVAFPVGLILARLLIGVTYIRDLRAFQIARREAEAAEAARSGAGPGPGASAG